MSGSKLTCIVSLLAIGLAITTGTSSYSVSAYVGPVVTYREVKFQVGFYYTSGFGMSIVSYVELYTQSACLIQRPLHRILFCLSSHNRL